MGSVPGSIRALYGLYGLPEVFATCAQRAACASGAAWRRNILYNLDCGTAWSTSVHISFSHLSFSIRFVERVLISATGKVLRAAEHEFVDLPCWL